MMEISKKIIENRKTNKYDDDDDDSPLNDVLPIESGQKMSSLNR
jgi:hypothetical protein